jgi:YrbI family 3-deoxy-D-manno-octulosonate 8-phosphate phosphatase
MFHEPSGACCLQACVRGQNDLAGLVIGETNLGSEKTATKKTPRSETRLEIDWTSLKFFATDVDGTLTDGGMYYTPDGELMKRFDTRDAFGMNLLREAGFELAIVTAENSPIVAARASKLKIDRVFLGVRDKVKLLTGVLDGLGLDWVNLAYAGDDLNDLPLMQMAGFSACPSDAAREVRSCADHVCSQSGGRGAVREICDLIRDHLRT